MDRALDWAGKPGNRILTLADPDYPQLLLESADPPSLLYVKGRVELLNRPALAIVGSRNATPQGLKDAEALAADLAAQGLTIVSGLALGIDGAAHRGGLKGEGGSVAIIGTGADRIYPSRHKELALQLATEGAIVSEFPWVHRRWPTIFPAATASSPAWPRAAWWWKPPWKAAPSSPPAWRPNWAGKCLPFPAPSIRRWPRAATG